MDTILVILGLLVASALVYYFGFYKQGKINDADGDFIPDEIEEAVEDVKEVVKEVKRRGKRVKEEVKDVVEELKDVVDQAKDITDAAKGKPRRGRKAKK
jgi:gas vesicle protein